MIKISEQFPPSDTLLKVKLYNPITMKKEKTVGMIKKIPVDWCLTKSGLTPSHYRYEFVPYTNSMIYAWKILKK